MGALVVTVSLRRYQAEEGNSGLLQGRIDFLASACLFLGQDGLISDESFGAVSSGGVAARAGEQSFHHLDFQRYHK